MARTKARAGRHRQSPSPPPQRIPYGWYDPRVLAVGCGLCEAEPGGSCRRGSSHSQGRKMVGFLSAPHPQRVQAAQALEDRIRR